MDPADRRRRRRARGGRDRAEDRAARLRIGTLHADLEKAGYAWTRRASAADLFKPGDLVDVAITKLDAATGDRDRDARADAAGRGRDPRDRQPYRSDQGDGRRLELQPQQVQPRGPGVPSARVDVQADRLHRRDRPRLHADVDHRRRAGQLQPATASDLQPAQLRSQVPGPDHAALRARRVAQHSRDQDDGYARAEERARVREAVRVRGGLSALPADRARRRRRDAARHHQRLHHVPQSGRADEAVLGADREGPRRQPARGEPRRAERRDPRRHRVRDDEHAARRPQPARHRRQGAAWRSRGRSPARPARSTTTPTRGSSASIPTSPSACGLASTTSASRSAAPSRARSRRCRSGWSS